MKEVAERMPIPRALYCDFPLGRPLGRPGDPEFQRRVLDAAFGLLDAAGPTLATYPETILDDVEAPLACPMPPRLDPNLPPAVDEMRGLRRAFERAAAGGVRTAVDVAAVEPALRAFQAIVDGTPWDRAGIPENPVVAALNIRGYYEQAAAALADHVPAARSAESWFARQTAAGRLMHDAQQAMKDARAPFPLWFYLLPASQHRLT
jgi:hypothetical protein